MVDPIEEEEIRRSSRTKQIQAYQNYLDEVDKTTSSKPVGKMQGKTVKNLSQGESSVTSLFNRFVRNRTP